MTEREKSITQLVRRRERDGDSTRKESTPFEKLFEGDWEEFVVKFDEMTGKFITRKVCCSMETVN